MEYKTTEQTISRKCRVPNVGEVWTHKDDKFNHCYIRIVNDGFHYVGNKDDGLFYSVCLKTGDILNTKFKPVDFIILRDTTELDFNK